MRVAVVLSLCAALATPARADGDDQRARGHYEIGLGLYRLGDYRGALKEFAAGYELAHKPGFLLNLGQTYRKLGELREARDMYRQFLAELRGDDPARPQAQQVLAEIEETIRTQPPARSPPAVRAAPPEPASPVAVPSPTVATPPVEPTPVVAARQPSLHASAPAHRRRRSLRIAGITIGVAGLGLVGAGVGTAVAADGLARDLDAVDRAGGVFDPSKDSAYTLDRTLSAACFAGGALLAASGAVLLIVSAR